jgi:hypothetical protein
MIVRDTNPAILIAAIFLTGDVAFADDEPQFCQGGDFYDREQCKAWRQGRPLERSSSDETVELFQPSWAQRDEDSSIPMVELQEMQELLAERIARMEAFEEGRAPSDTFCGVTVGRTIDRSGFSCDGSSCQKEYTLAGERGLLDVGLCKGKVHNITFRVTFLPPQVYTEMSMGGDVQALGARPLTSSSAIEVLYSKFGRILENEQWWCPQDAGEFSEEERQGGKSFTSTIPCWAPDGRQRKISVSGIGGTDIPGGMMSFFMIISHAPTECVEGW